MHEKINHPLRLRRKMRRPDCPTRRILGEERRLHQRSQRNGTDPRGRSAEELTARHQRVGGRRVIQITEMHAERKMSSSDEGNAASQKRHDPGFEICFSRASFM